jgi:hypothetical protein
VQNQYTLVSPVKDDIAAVQRIGTAGGDDSFITARNEQRIQYCNPAASDGWDDHHAEVSRYLQDKNFCLLYVTVVNLYDSYILPIRAAGSAALFND